MRSPNGRLSGLLWIIIAVACAWLPAQSIGNAAAAGAPPGARSFDTPQHAARALINAAEAFDMGALVQIVGTNGEDLVSTGEPALDRQRAANFAAQAGARTRVAVDPSGDRAVLIVGSEDWPFPVPIVKSGGKWFFDIQAGRQELLYRRIGTNELDAITICRGYVNAQYEYALQPRQGYAVPQYAQRIISTPGTQDGLAWQNPDGTWGGPIGENVARAVQQGYTSRTTPFHGYYFKVLNAQGPAAPLGAMDFVVEGAMIGGFALAAAPAEYEVTGVKTFIVSWEGVVYQKDLGPNSLATFQNMTVYNPDKTWQRTDDNWH